MARPQTVARVHAAVLSLAERAGPDALTMEGIAAEAGVGKQTLYRSWPSVHAILFDALVAEPEGTRAGDGDGDGTIVGLLRATIEEISTEPRASLLRLLAASIQTDAAVAAQFVERLLGPQLTQVRRLVAAAGYAQPQTSPNCSSRRSSIGGSCGYPSSTTSNSASTPHGSWRCGSRIAQGQAQ